MTFTDTIHWLVNLTCWLSLTSSLGFIPAPKRQLDQVASIIIMASGPASGLPPDVSSSDKAPIYPYPAPSYQAYHQEPQQFVNPPAPHAPAPSAPPPSANNDANRATSERRGSSVESYDDVFKLSKPVEVNQQIICCHYIRGDYTLNSS